MTLSAAPTHVWEFNGNYNDSVGDFDLSNLGSTDADGKPTYGLAAGSLAYKEPEPYALCLGEWSISTWIKLPATVTDTSTLVLVGDVSLVIVGGRTGWQVNRASATPPNVTYTASISSGVWLHILITRASDDTLTIYQNGASVHVGAYTSHADGLSFISIGDDQGWGIQTGQTATFESALTADDATYLYNAGAGRAYADWEIAEAEETGNPFIENIQRFQLLT